MSAALVRASLLWLHADAVYLHPAGSCVCGGHRLDVFTHAHPAYDDEARARLLAVAR